MIVHRLLWKLFHIEDAIEKNTENIEAKNKTIKGLKTQQVMIPY